MYWAVYLAWGHRCGRLHTENTKTAMKRNMVPLLGIAFVVAIISTGVFYGLFAGRLRSSSDLPSHGIVVAARDLDRGTVLQPGDLRVSEVQGALEGGFSNPQQASGAVLLAAMKANEPLLEERVSMPVTGSARPGGPVPAGMRAVTMHIFQSESLLSLLRPGSRVDVQAVLERNGLAELRTVLENVQVLSVGEGGSRSAGAIVTVLIRAEDADMVALADSGSRIRLALRNPLDDGTMRHNPMAVTALFSAAGNEDLPKREAASAPPTAVWDHPIQLHVWALSATGSASEELRARCSPVGSDHAWRVATFDAGDDDAAKLIHSLEQKHEVEVVSSERLMAGVGRPISYRAGTKPYQLRVEFSPEWLPAGKLALRVKPEVDIPDALGIATIKYDVGLPDASSFLLERSANDPSGDGSAARLFPGHSWEHRHLLIFVSARILQQQSQAAVARAGRRR